MISSYLGLVHLPLCVHIQKKILLVVLKCSVAIIYLSVQSLWQVGSVCLMWHHKARFHTQCHSWVQLKPWFVHCHGHYTLEDGQIFCHLLIWSQICQTHLHQKSMTNGSCCLRYPRQTDAPPLARLLLGQQKHNVAGGLVSCQELNWYGRRHQFCSLR